MNNEGFEGNRQKVVKTNHRSQRRIFRRGVDSSRRVWRAAYPPNKA